MRSQSPLVRQENYKYSVNFFTPIRNKHITQLSTGKNLLGSPSIELQQQQTEIIPQFQKQILQKQKQTGTPKNYYQVNGQLKKIGFENHGNMLFKSGYEQQEEIKRLNKENEDLKEIIKKQEEQLQKFLEMANILQQNRLLQEKVEKLEKERVQENQDKEDQKIEKE